MDTDSALASCAYDLESAMGSIRIDGTTYDTPQRKTEGELSLTASSGMGDITVTSAVDGSFNLFEKYAAAGICPPPLRRENDSYPFTVPSALNTGRGAR